MAVRLNTRVSDRANEWLDKKAEEMAISKSALVAFAVEQYMKQEEVANHMPEYLKYMREMEKSEHV